MDWKHATVVTGLTVIGFAPGYFRAQEIASSRFEMPVTVKAPACSPSFGDPLAELCKQVSEVDSDAFHVKQKIVRLLSVCFIRELRRSEKI